MPFSSAIWSLILLALIGANLAFLNQRLFALIPLFNSTAKPAIKKSFWLRLLEMMACYFLLGVVAYFFESSIGNVFPQGWEFFAITGCLFVVLAFPGFVFQYLRRQ